ncbi:MAG: aminofutalosine synthase MqnE [Candidatus Altiarchaeales archaeon IMC4]|nr:MAG: aminofutalosine synthase MqnE [Candidatus Altiarchaeales archaeon IMC4]
MTSNKDIHETCEKALNGEKLDKKEGISLMNSNDLLLLGDTADKLRKKTAGDIVTFVSNRQVNYTNICSSKCRFCAFYRDKDSQGAYVMSVEDVLKKIKDSVHRGITEVHIVGSLNPDLPLDYYETMLAEIKKNFPEIHIKAFTATEIAFLAKQNKSTIKEILGRFKEAGLGSIPGGGAEILNDGLREKLCPNKASSSQWLNVMETAHKIGIKSNSTMLYGHIETPKDRVEHILKIRDLQEKTGGFQVFIPLSFHPQNTELYRHGMVKNPPGGFDDLRVLAVSRILLNGCIDNIRAYWVMLGKKLAQVSLNYGVNDMDGTVVEERIAHAAGGYSDGCATKEELVMLIKGAGRVPAQRTTDYEIIKIFE